MWSLKLVCLAKLFFFKHCFSYYNNKSKFVQVYFCHSIILAQNYPNSVRPYQKRLKIIPKLRTPLFLPQKNFKTGKSIYPLWFCMHICWDKWVMIHLDSIEGKKNHEIYLTHWKTITTAFDMCIIIGFLAQKKGNQIQ